MLTRTPKVGIQFAYTPENPIVTEENRSIMALLPKLFSVEASFHAEPSAVPTYTVMAKLHKINPGAASVVMKVVNEEESLVEAIGELMPSVDIECYGVHGKTSLFAPFISASSTSGTTRQNQIQTHRPTKYVTEWKVCKPLYFQLNSFQHEDGRELTAKVGVRYPDVMELALETTNRLNLENKKLFVAAAKLWSPLNTMFELIFNSEEAELFWVCTQLE